jgi:hypothetical protein
MTSKYFGKPVGGVPPQKLEVVHKLANAFVEKKLDGVLDEIEAAIRGSSGAFTWTRESARQVVGRQIALAYAMGALDRTENQTVKKIYVQK